MISEETKRKMSLSHRGIKNPRWKGGISKYPNNRVMRKNRLIVLLTNPQCEICGNKATQIHHKDLSKNNHILSNLMAVCNKCNILLSNKFYQAYGMTLKEIAIKMNKNMTYCSVLHQEGLLKKYLEKICRFNVY